MFKKFKHKKLHNEEVLDNQNNGIDDATNISEEEKISIELIYKSGLFNADYYHQLNPDVEPEHALVHYFYNGHKEKRKPSFLFDPEYYFTANADVANSGFRPLTHYIIYGESESRNPSVFCDIEHLKSQIDIDSESKALAYFYINEIKYKISAHPYFDVNYYLSENEDVKNSGVSPYYHFLHTGCYEGRKPRADIDLNKYINTYGVDKELINPFYHFISFNGSEFLSEEAHSAQLEIIQNNSSSDTVNYREKGPNYEEPEYLDADVISPQVKALAYYLPQFHPFKENDEWWGQGFTEWTNVTRGMPRFDGHYQPHLPKHLGYYDLRVKEAMAEQVRYAKAAGIHGFCFYHYWFNGKRLMEKPVNILLENKDIDMPFCIMWANENWTRTWDGLENDVLIAQDYLDEDDVPFIQDLGRHFADSRYIRVDGRPLFFIYRPGIIPNAKETIEKWRGLCEKLLGEKPLFYMAQAFGDNDPRKFGMDGAIEFPPHKIAAGLTDSSRALGGYDSDFQGHYPTYDELVERSLSEVISDEFPVIRGVTPSWDNEARKPNRGMGYIGSTPAKYQQWLQTINQQAKANPIADGESFVVINAWNEWAEGAHLEPDVYWGAAYLNATYRAMHGISKLDKKLKLLLVGHDAYKHGAQLLTLNIFKTLRERFGIDVTCILLDGGPLVESYKEVGLTYVAHGSLDEFNKIIESLNKENNFNYAICNTTVTGKCVESLSKQGIAAISLIHELNTLIEEYSLQEHAKLIAKYASKIVFAAHFVKDSFESLVGELGNKAIVKPQGIYQSLSDDSESKQKLRAKLQLPSDSKIVVNSGFADLRKGFDLFVQTAKECLNIDRRYHFVWLGNVQANLENWILKDIKGSELEKHIHIVPFTNEISLYLQGADAFAMTSREDPFPSVVLESLALGTPVVGFEGGGGYSEAVKQSHFGELVAMADCQAMAQAIEGQILGDNSAHQLSRSSITKQNYDWGDYVFSLVEYLIPSLKRVSVAVPNYNYEKYISSRLVSIFEQEYPVFEIIVLDDKSPDNSIEVIRDTAFNHNRQISLVVNEENSGSVFKQWKKSSDLAEGEFLWIAEADDLAEPEFLSTIMSGDTSFTMAYTDSKQIDENDQHLADDYRYYYEHSMITLLDKPDVYPGKKVIEDCLSVKNQFMNVSSIVFSLYGIKKVFNDYYNDVLKFKVAGDWFLYINLLSQDNSTCKIIKKSLNFHRRHEYSVTKMNYDIQMREIEFLHDLCRKNFKCDEKEQSRYIDEVFKVLSE